MSECCWKNDQLQSFSFVNFLAGQCKLECEDKCELPSLGSDEVFFGNSEICLNYSYIFPVEKRP